MRGSQEKNCKDGLAVLQRLPHGGACVQENIYVSTSCLSCAFQEHTPPSSESGAGQEGGGTRHAASQTPALGHAVRGGKKLPHQLQRGLCRGTAKQELAVVLLVRPAMGHRGARCVLWRAFHSWRFPLSSWLCFWRLHQLSHMLVISNSFSFFLLLLCCWAAMGVISFFFFLFFGATVGCTTLLLSKWSTDSFLF